MSAEVRRRDFAFRGAAGLAGVMAGQLLSAEKTDAPERDPSAKRLIVLGLNALARAHSMKYFADGHRGAAFIAAHFLCEENQLPEAARSRIEQLFDLNWAKTPLCAPFPQEDADPTQVKKIGEALIEAHGSLREVGHNAIFAMHAFRAFQLMPELATPQRIDGVCRLIRAIRPWRDDVRVDEAVSPPPFKDTAEASAFVLREACTAIDRWHCHGQGFTGHMLTFGQSLVELAGTGQNDWAESCREAFCRYVTITRMGPGPADKAFAEHAPSMLRPNTAEYWRQRGDKTLGIGHAFKYPYSYYDLLRRVENEALKQELEEKVWRVF